MEKLVAKITRDRDGSTIRNEVTANSTNPTKDPIIDSAVDPAAEPVAETGKADRVFLNIGTSNEEGTNRDDDEVDFTMANRPIYFDKYEWVWRCRVCGWEIEADEDYIVGSCRNGHCVELRRVKGYFPAYDDSEEEKE